MEKPTIEAMAERLGRLERECRRWRRVGGAALVAALALSLGAAQLAPPAELAARSFSLRDKDGKERAALHLTEDGNPRLYFEDRDGACRMSLVMMPDGNTLLYFSDRQDKIRLQVGTLIESGQPSIALLGQDGKARLALGVNKDGVPSVNFTEEPGDLRLSVQVREGVPTFHFYRPGLQKVGPELSLIYDDRDGKPRLTLLDGEGEAVGRLPEPEGKAGR